MRMGDAGTQGAPVYGEILSPLEMAYADSANTIAPGIVDAARMQSMPGESLIDSLARAISTVSLADAQRRLLNVQIDRAQRGLPPLNAAQYGAGVNVGLSPDVQRLLMWGGAALIVALVLPSIMRAMRGRS